jgi:hypothetical protein
LGELATTRSVDFAARHTEMTKARGKLATAFRGDGFAGADVEAFIQAKRDMHPDIADAAMEKAENLHRVLTPDQRVTLADAMESGELGHHRRRRGGPHSTACASPSVRGGAGTTRGERRWPRPFVRRALTGRPYALRSATSGRLMTRGVLRWKGT